MSHQDSHRALEWLKRAVADLADQVGLSDQEALGVGGLMHPDAVDDELKAGAVWKHDEWHQALSSQLPWVMSETHDIWFDKLIQITCLQTEDSLINIQNCLKHMILQLSSHKDSHGDTKRQKKERERERERDWSVWWCVYRVYSYLPRAVPQDMPEISDASRPSTWKLGRDSCGAQWHSVVLDEFSSCLCFLSSFPSVRMFQ